MAVYIDQLQTSPTSARWRHPTHCHMMADDLEQLEALALRLGLRPNWRHGDHYDLTENKRRQAIELGAVPTTARHLVELRRQVNLFQPRPIKRRPAL